LVADDEGQRVHGPGGSGLDGPPPARRHGETRREEEGGEHVPLIMDARCSSVLRRRSRSQNRCGISGGRLVAFALPPNKNARRCVNVLKTGSDWYAMLAQGWLDHRFIGINRT
jgi:hypothetical protein